MRLEERIPSNDLIIVYQDPELSTTSPDKAVKHHGEMSLYVTDQAEKVLMKLSVVLTGIADHPIEHLPEHNSTRAEVARHCSALLRSRVW
jgi:hypothetical protein